MMETEQYKEILSRYLPQEAVDGIFDYVRRHGVRLSITASRKSKLGDYRWPRKGANYHQISVNGDLNPYHFLYVLLHEFAHLETFETYGKGVRPHGHEWQDAFARLLLQWVWIFPSDIQQELLRYCKRVPLSHEAGLRLEESLKRYGGGCDGNEIMLRDLPVGTSFGLKERPGRTFVSVEKRRTRFVCRETSTGALYLIGGYAVVALVE